MDLFWFLRPKKRVECVKPELFEAPPSRSLELKLCTVCKNREEKIIGGDDYSCCNAPSNCRIDRATGAIVRIYKFCSVHRDGEHAQICGTSGKWFDPIDMVKVSK